MIKNDKDIVVIGAGYVGLELAISLSKKYNVICYDINKLRIIRLKKGTDQNLQYDKSKILNKNLLFTSNDKLIFHKLTYIVTVPTPITRTRKPDLSMLKSASKLVGKCIKKKSTIIFESTTFPGCTEEICIPIIEKNSKLKFSIDFDVGYSPERVNPGDKVNKLETITKIVSSNNKKTLIKISKIYKKICKSIYPIVNIKIAECAKVIENVQRDLNIAFINELSILFNKLNIPTNEVLKAASTKWNFHYYKPGLVGGHCISVDPYYLAYKAKKINYLPKILLSGRKLNESMGRYVAKQTIKLINKNNLNLKLLRIAILGFSFKDNIPDIRNTKVIQIINEFKNYKIKTDIIDPIVCPKQAKSEYNINIRSFNFFKKHKYDVIILAVSHQIFLKKINFYLKYYKNINKKIFVDIKNNYSNEELKKNNFIYFQL